MTKKNFFQIFFYKLFVLVIRFLKLTIHKYAQLADLLRICVVLSPKNGTKGKKYGTKMKKKLFFFVALSTIKNKEELCIRVYFTFSFFHAKSTTTNTDLKFSNKILFQRPFNLKVAYLCLRTWAGSDVFSELLYTNLNACALQIEAC